MADTPQPGATDDAAPPDQPPRRTLPRAARLSRLAPSGGEPATAEPAPDQPAPDQPAPVTPVAKLPSSEVTPPAVTEQPVLAQTQSAPPAPPPSAPTFGGSRVVELVPGGSSRPSPAVLAAQQAAARAAARPSTPSVTFKPLQDSLATRSAIISVIGLLLCFFPVLSLIGLGMGIVARRRIQRSAGQLIGGGSASLGILLGAAGVAIGVTADIVFLLRR